jgi:soluble lytic murein transglycosylase-like protein
MCCVTLVSLFNWPVTRNVALSLMQTGKATGALTAMSAPFSIDQTVREAAAEHRVDPAFIKSIIHAESSFQLDAISPKGAIGLMQLMPETAQELGYDPTNPKENIHAGTAYLSYLMNLYRHRKNGLQLAVAAYNAGPGNVARYRGIPPFRETRTYVKRVMHYYAGYRRTERKERVTRQVHAPDAMPAD